ncbi:MAG: hypothetical protein NTV58_01960 [Deltaproteobacteria bacterium]|nr:hypothetical protein [Deltaproteobacteria bacterium]
MSSDDTIRVYRTDQLSPLCTIRISEASTAARGELDVFVQAARGRFFERITAQRADRFVDYGFPGKINACTWHGNYVNLNGRIEGPKIHLKSGDRKLSWTVLDGVIEQKRIFMFPVFSLYIPTSFPVGSQEHKKKSRGAAQRLVLDDKNVRVDFFLLPKHVDKDQFEKLTVAKMALCHDITMYNRQMRGVLIYLDNCQVELGWYRLKSWWSVIRCVYPQFGNIEQYWIYFHDTFDPLACILDRGYSPGISNEDAEDEETAPSHKLFLRDLHEKELKDLGLI